MNGERIRSLLAPHRAAVAAAELARGTQTAKEIADYASL